MPRPALLPPHADALDAGERNVRLLSILRWLAVGGQLATILLVQLVLGIPLPLVPLLGASAVLAVLNLVIAAIARVRRIDDRVLFATFLADVACLTVQLFLTGGVGNPFVTLYLLQVVIAAVLLPEWSSWALVGLTSALFAWLASAAPPFVLPVPRLSMPYVVGSWFNFTLAASLLVLFVTRIQRNLSERDARVAALREEAAEAEHVVRLGLLASGAAHELGTPLSSVAVMLGDWRREATIARNPALAADLDAMRGEIARCKDILSQVLRASGEVRGAEPRRTSVRAFLGTLVSDWPRGEVVEAAYRHRMPADPRIVADRALAQTITALLDNAADAGARTVTVEAEGAGAVLSVSVRDDGAGFDAAILSRIGKPYLSTKGREGAGLGLFLATNVLRTLGGRVEAANREGGGAEVRLTLPLAALAIGEA